MVEKRHYKVQKDEKEVNPKIDIKMGEEEWELKLDKDDGRHYFNQPINH